MQMSNDGGGTWKTSGYLSGFNSTPYNSTTWTNINSTADFVLSGALDNGASTSFGNGLVEIYLIGSNLTYITGTCTYFDNTGGTQNMALLSGRSGNNGANAFRILMSSGNITTGSFYMYGMKET
jgi:hypothetical protein